MVTSIMTRWSGTGVPVAHPGGRMGSSLAPGRSLHRGARPTIAAATAAVLLFAGMAGGVSHGASPLPGAWEPSPDGTLETYVRMGPIVRDGEGVVLIGQRCDPYGNGPCGVDLLGSPD